MWELERHPTDTTAPREQALPPIVLIGRGRVGGSLSGAARAAGLDVRSAGRDDLNAGCASAEVALLCVPDGEIENACRQVAAHAPRLRFVGHTSGATTLRALRSATDAGALAFSLHPLQTVPDGSTPVAGAPAAIAGSDGDSLDLARDLAEALGMVPFEVPEHERAAYHAAASMASNFLIALEESASALLAKAGAGDPGRARELLTPLVLRTATNWSERGGEALTGPIARGDAATVAAHRAALADSAPELLDLYDAMAERTQAVAGGAPA